MEIPRALQLPPSREQCLPYRAESSLGGAMPLPSSPTPPPPPPPPAAAATEIHRPHPKWPVPTPTTTPGPFPQAAPVNTPPDPTLGGTSSSAFERCAPPVFPWSSWTPSMANPTQPTSDEREAARALLVVAETERFAPPPRRKVTTRGPLPCRCGKTHCLKLYCMCFRNDKRCTSACECTDCHNDGAHEEARMLAVRTARMNSQGAFAGTGLEAQGQTVQCEGGAARTVYGCRCKQSQCRKKYCQCFAAGLVCGANCICEGCRNVKA